MITKELLISHGWELKEDPILSKLSEEDKKQMDAEGIQYDWEEYTFNYLDSYFLTMRYGLSNTIGREWLCHIDNNLHEGVACVDIGTTVHFNKLMELMGIPYSL